MSPELDRLLNAMWERDKGEPQHRQKWDATVNRLIVDALARQPGLSLEEFMDAVKPRYEAFRFSPPQNYQPPAQSVTRQV